MAFSLDPAEPIGDGVRRVAHEQLRGAIQRLVEGTADRDDDIHSARKAMKRMRALVRLVRTDLGKDGYRQENEAYRLAARQLAGQRDVAVLVATLDDLAAGVGAAGAEAFRPLREALVHPGPEPDGDDAAYRAAAYAAAAPVAAVVAALRRADERVDDWPLPGGAKPGGAVPDDSFPSLAAGLQRVYQRGRVEFEEACWRPSVESLHQWRKRAKYLWYQVQLLRPLWPGPLAAWESELDRLGDLLGRDHDLALLVAAMRLELARRVGGPSDPLLSDLISLAGRRRHRLQAEARILGMRAYAERPRALSRRLRGYRRAWLEELILALPPPASADAGPGGQGPQPERVADTRCRAGEGPLWHADEGRLYWVDIPEGRLWRYDPVSGQGEEAFQGEAIGGITVQADGSLLLFMARGAVAVWRQGEPLRRVVEEIEVERDSRFSDVIADPAGRVFCGTMPGAGRGGRLYRLDLDGTLTELLDGVGIPDGMGFTPDHRHLYFIDSPAKKIFRFDYDRSTGELSQRKVFIDTADQEGIPDGLTVDAEGGIWCALWDGGCLVRYRPDGALERRFTLPARKVSGAAFGGAGLEELYVTTAGGCDRAAEGDGAGALFRLRPGVRGLPELRSRIGL